MESVEDHPLAHVPNENIDERNEVTKTEELTQNSDTAEQVPIQANSGEEISFYYHQIALTQAERSH